MRRQLKPVDLAIGRIAAIAVAVETIAFGLSLVLGLAVRSNLGPMIGYGVSLVLAVSVVVLMSAFYFHSPSETKMLGLLGTSRRSTLRAFVLLELLPAIVDRRNQPVIAFGRHI